MNPPRKLSVLCVPLAGLMLAGALTVPSAYAADGAGVFLTECGECHSVKPGKNKKGPSLFGVAGRPAGTVADFAGYSDALKNSKWTWTPAQLKTYLSQSSSKALPGTKMKYDGLDDPKGLDALIAYLNTLK
ncbi:c-type cytochrome [Xanthomonas phaseoli]|uniref:C-type cytochrome n=1 Tax=Xanthomonas manihotis TaxID=43353 RepID=A0A8I1XME2_XANMN|nr:c-type cytochrome [Xanthomonas phaseoli]KUF26476.1 cytochrome C [Xanthomonas phaseoli pv. manihotis]MBO9720182.1 c-type cytochrome [Xanthomonas phaseoli pv. manihotis]MBO9756778.1 c-type cytochrome [Xanthomonas phaseoli pv. manihotis]MBO9761476.1 c-type cytochrome [Xanthomonas phaseoli pv. manihotis]MBO9765295.1 c-type cytochrome [Xanthomonas phaseoli pv. manihotis]